VSKPISKVNIANIITTKSRVEDINSSDFDDIMQDKMPLVYSPAQSNGAKMYDQLINSPKFMSKL
jgi:hypothetical protein